MPDRSWPRQRRRAPCSTDPRWSRWGAGSQPPPGSGRMASASRPVAPRLAGAWAALPDFPDLAAPLHDALDPDGRLTDRASPRLRALRRQIATLRADLQARVERLLDHPAVQPALQERYVTVRNGRYVIPVRDDARRAVRGIIHDRSQSGATVFVEPEETIPLNNELTRVCLEERDEELRLLAELTDGVRRILPALAGARRGARRPRPRLRARHARRAARRGRAGGGRRRRPRPPRGAPSPAGRPALGRRVRRRRGDPDRPPGAGGPARPGAERSERGRQDRRARDRRAARPDGARRLPHPRRAGQPRAVHRAGARGDRRRAEPGPGPVHVLVVRPPGPRDPDRRRAGVAGPPGRARRGHRPDGGRGARRRAPRGAPRPRRAHRGHDAPRAAQGLRPGGAAPPERDGRVRRRAARADVPARVRAPRAEPRAHDRRAARPSRRGDRPRPAARRRGEPPDRDPPRRAGGAHPRRRGARRGGRPPRGRGDGRAGRRPGRGRSRADRRAGPPPRRRGAGADPPRQRAAAGRPGARPPEGRRGGRGAGRPRRPTGGCASPRPRFSPRPRRPTSRPSQPRRYRPARFSSAGSGSGAASSRRPTGWSPCRPAASR